MIMTMYVSNPAMVVGGTGSSLGVEIDKNNMGKQYVARYIGLKVSPWMGHYLEPTR